MYETSSITLNITYLNIALSNTNEETTVITGLVWFNCIGNNTKSYFQRTENYKQNKP